MIYVKLCLSNLWICRLRTILSLVIKTWWNTSDFQMVFHWVSKSSTWPEWGDVVSLQHHELLMSLRIIIEEFNACLKCSRFCKKIKDFTLINACHQNIEGKIITFVTSFWFSCQIRDYPSYELNYTENYPSFSKCYGLYCDETQLFFISWGDFKATWCMVVEKLWIMPAYASHKATSTCTTKNNIQRWEILPSTNKEIMALKRSWSLGYNLTKRIVLQRRIVWVSLTDVNLCQTIML